MPESSGSRSRGGRAGGRGRRGAGYRRRSGRAGAPSARQARVRASRSLKRFRQGSRLAIGATALVLLLLGGAAVDEDAAVTGATGSGAAVSGAAVATAGQQAAVQEDPLPTAAPVGDTAPTDTAATDTAAPADPGESARRATGTLRDLGRTLYNTLPAIGIAILVLLLAAALARLVRTGLRALFASWARADAVAALAGILIWLIALGAALSVIAGDARALLGSIGLFGLALSWALQAPIESFTGWVLNSFRSYYRVGDRISVGEVFGDVASIDFLTTTVFEAGGPDKRVQAAQSTGAFVTFPNSEILRANIVNYTRDFPYVWDELTVAVANESNISRGVRILGEIAYREVGERMEGAAQEYGTLLERAGLAWDVATRPEVFVAAKDSWTELTVRYMVPAREMRVWSTRLLIALNEAFEDPVAAAGVYPGYTRTQVQPLPQPAWTRPQGSPEDES